MTSALPLLALIILAALGYAASLWAKPLTPCRHCDGMGSQVRYDRTGRSIPGKPCRHCRTTGRRVRLGRRIYTAARAIRRDGTR